MFCNGNFQLKKKYNIINLSEKLLTKLCEYFTIYGHNFQIMRFYKNFNY